MIGKKDLLTVFVVLTVISGFILLALEIVPPQKSETGLLDDGNSADLDGGDSSAYDNASEGMGQTSVGDANVSYETVNETDAGAANSSGVPTDSTAYHIWNITGDDLAVDASVPTLAEEEKTDVTPDSNTPVTASESNDEGASQLIPQSTAVIFIISGMLSLIIFARLKTEDILAGVRKYIYVYIQENPGVHLAGIRKEFELSSSSARHHLYVLEESDLIISYKAGKMKHYYLNKSGYSNFLAGKEYKAIISALKNDTSRNIVKYLLAHKDSNQKKLSEILEIHPSTVNWHAKRLGDAGIIQSTRRGKDVLYSVNAEIDLDKIVNLIEGRGTLAR